MSQHEVMTSRNSSEFFVFRIRGGTVGWAIFTLLLSLLTLYWLILDTAPPRWDQSNYLEISETFYQALRAGDLAQFLHAYRGALWGIKAPLLGLLPLPAYFLLGNGKLAVDLTLIAVIVLFCLIYYKLGIDLGLPRWAALFAVIVTSTMPNVYGLSRNFLVEYGLMALVTLWMWSQVRSQHFRSIPLNCALGAILGFGWLMKLPFPIYVVGPAIFGAIVRLQNGPSWWEVTTLLLSGLLILFVGGAIASTWYLPDNIHTAIGFGLSAGFGEVASTASMGNRFELSTLLAYWKQVTEESISTYHSLLFVLLLLACLARRFRTRSSDTETMIATRPGSVGLLVAWFIVPLAVYSFGENKDSRYLLPTFPALGIAIAILFSSAVRERKWRIVGAPLALLFPVALLLYATLPLDLDWSWKVDGWALLQSPVGLAGRPVQELWPDSELIQMIDKDSYPHLPGVPKILVLVVPNRPYLNQYPFRYYTAHLNLESRFTWGQLLSTGTESPQRWQEVLEWVRQWHYIISATGAQGVSAVRNAEINDLLSTGALPYSAWTELDLPDGTHGVVYRQND